MAKRFTTLTEWNDFMKGRKVLIMNKQHDWYGHEMDFVAMVGEKEVLKEQHPSKIQMKVKTQYGTELLLNGNDFMIIEKKIIQDGANN